MKNSSFSRAICVLICVGIAVSLLCACGAYNAHAPGDAADTSLPASSELISQGTTAPEAALTYFQQEQQEFAGFGFSGGDLIMGSDESEVLGQFSDMRVNSTNIDLSADNVPFTLAKQVTTDTLPTNWWEDYLSKNFLSDFSVTAGDIVAGCMWIKDGGGADPAQCYIAVKTAIDNWATEGAPSVTQLRATDQWTKIYFYAQFMYDGTTDTQLCPDNASAYMFQIYLGFGVQQLDVGGLFLERFPGTDANYKAEVNIPYPSDNAVPYDQR